MKIRLVDTSIVVELEGAEAKVLLNELLDVPGGSKLPKMRQLCTSLGNFFEVRTVPLGAYNKKGNRI